MATIIIEAIILGIIQGAAEFIPISSSAHLIIIPWLFGWTDPALTSLAFDVALHLGTLVAVLAFFAKDWLSLIRSFFQSISDRRVSGDPNRKLAWLIVICTLPGGIAGVLFESKIEALFHQSGVPIARSAMIIMAVIIAAFGVLLLLADRLAKHVHDLDQLNLRNALLIGLSQALAIFPGISRSGSTISSGLALGFKRQAAAKFSFLLSAPIIAGAGVKSLWEIYSSLRIGEIARTDLLLFPVGIIVAAISGFLCIRYLLKYLQKHNMNIFVYYRWGLAILIVVVALIR